MGPAQTELLVLAHAALSTQKLKALREHDIAPSDFLHYPQIYDLLSDTFTRTGALPATGIVVQFFPDLPLDQIETTSYEGALERFLEQVAGHRLSTLLADVSNHYARTGHANEAHDKLVAGLPGLTPQISRALSYTDYGAADRIAEYRARQQAYAATGILGTRTGLAIFDGAARGWEPGEFSGIVARPYVGKSWVLVHSACTAYQHGKRVLFVSPEMSRGEVNLRADQLLFPTWGGNPRHYTLPLQELLTGQLPGQTERLYEGFLNDFANEKRWVTVDALADRGIRPSTIDTLIVQHQPDLVCIDGLMLLDSPYEQVWEKAKDIAYSLKNTATTRRVPVLFVTQANRSTRNRDDVPSLDEVAFGDAIGQAADRVVGLGFPSSGARTVRLLQCQKFRNGWADFHARKSISFNPDEGDIGRVVADHTQDAVDIDETEY